MQKFCAGQSSGSTGQSSGSTLFEDFIKSGGAPYKHGINFYVPQGLDYVVDYYAQCGGRGGDCDPATGVCQDAPYRQAGCPEGFECGAR